MSQPPNFPESDPGAPEWTPPPVFPVFAQVEPPPAAESTPPSVDPLVTSASQLPEPRAAGASVPLAARRAVPLVAERPTPSTKIATPAEAERKQALAQAASVLRQRERAVRVEAVSDFPRTAAREPAAPPETDMQAAGRRTRVALAQVGVSLFLSLVATAGLLYWVWFSDMLAPLRLAWLGPSPAASVIFRLLCCFVLGAFVLPLIWLVQLKALARVAGPSPAQTEQALRQGGEQALASSRAFIEKTLADMRARGESEQDIADVRATLEEVQRKAQAEHEERVREWVRHPDRLRAHINETIREAQAREPN